MRWGSWPPSTGERNPGEEGSVPTSEFCHSAGPEVARTVWANPGSTHGSPGKGLSPNQYSGVTPQPQVGVGPLGTETQGRAGPQGACASQSLEKHSRHFLSEGEK